MDRFVPLDKKSKKEQKKFHAKQRRTWEGISPVTRTVPNGKAYNRKKLKANERRSSSDLICYPQVGHRNKKPTWGCFYVKKKQD